MMPSEQSSLINILAENGKSMRLWRLRQEMETKRALGFGVNIDDVIRHLLRNGRIKSNNQRPELDDNETISLK